MVNIYCIVLIVIVLAIAPILIAVVEYNMEHQKPRRGKDNRIKDKKLYRRIIAIAVIYYLVGIFMLVISGNLEKIINTIIGFKVSDKYLWCSAWSLIGFSVAISQRRFGSEDKKLAFLPYLAFYPFALLLISSLIYSLNIEQNDEAFYPLTLALRGSLSFLADYYWIAIKKTIKRLLNNS